MENKRNFAFGRKNYIIMFAGILILTTGFIIMTLDTEPYGLGFMGITLGPIVVLLGFAVEFFAIFYKDKSND